MISRYSVMILILGSLIFVETIFLMLLKDQIQDSVINLCFILGTVMMVYILVNITYTAAKNRQINQLEIERVLVSRRMHSMEMNYIEIILKNPTLTRFNAVRIIDNYPESFSLIEGSNTCTVTLPPYSKVRFAYLLKANERGSYKVGPTEIYVSDEYGYTLDYKKFENDTKIVVYPPIAKHIRRRLKKPSEQQSTGIKFSKKKGRGFDYVGSRKYLVGDEIKLIDWKFLAKTTEPGTKEFHIERNIDIMLVIDCSESMNASNGRETKLDSCVDTCSYLAYQFLKQGDSVGILTCAKDKINFIKPVHGSDEYHNLLSAIASIEGERGTVDLKKYVAHAMRNLNSKTIFFIFTDSNDQDELTKLANIIKDHRHDVMFVIPYIDLKYYDKLLPSSETKRHEEDYVTALSNILFMEDLNGINSVVDRLKRLGVKTVAARTDDVLNELIIRM